jgi:DNA-binding LacI/PurR family transcriptional regulator
VQLFRRPDRPAALFVHSDEQAIGVLHAAVTCEVRIPDDLAVASFDGIRESALVHPPLTTVQQPLELAAERAVELLIEGITTGDPKARNESLPVTLVVRESCGCPAPARAEAPAGRPADVAGSPTLVRSGRSN